MSAIPTFPPADFYDARESEWLEYDDPLDAIQDALDGWFAGDDTDDPVAIIREHGAMTVECYKRGTQRMYADGEESDEFDCDRIGGVDLTAEQTEALMREHRPDWFEAIP